jgi:site-specific DNA-methyltransferase (adenine-specific)
MKSIPNDSIDSVVTDPPYGISFMGKKWDYDVPAVEVWAECLRVLKPGGHLLAFAGTRTQHRMAVRIEDAGFEIRDMIAWVYGSGFPKSLDVSKAIDKAAGAEREVVGSREVTRDLARNGRTGDEAISPVPVIRATIPITAPATPEAQQWAGWGTALKPSLEPITVARKPLCGTVAENVLQHGTGGINVDGCRVGTNPGYRYRADANGTTFHGQQGERIKQSAGKKGCEFIESTQGRWPANLIHDGSDEVVGLFPETTSGDLRAGTTQGKGEMFETRGGKPLHRDYSGDSGSAARFFYCAKASKKDRGEGNNHPTVKPTDLMRYLCRLVTPPNGIVLDPFMGSGSTAVASIRENFNFVGIEMLREHFETAKRRVTVERGKIKS